MSIFQVIEIIIFYLKVKNAESMRKHLYNNPAIARKIFQGITVKKGVSV